LRRPPRERPDDLNRLDDTVQCNDVMFPALQCYLYESAYWTAGAHNCHDIQAEGSSATTG